MIKIGSKNNFGIIQLYAIQWTIIINLFVGLAKCANPLAKNKNVNIRDIEYKQLTGALDFVIFDINCLNV